MALIVVCLGQLMMVVDMTIVNVALPVIQQDLHSSRPRVVGAYLISYGLPPDGRMAGDLIGRKRVFLSGAPSSPSPPPVRAVASRCFRRPLPPGLGGATAISVIIALIVATGPDERVKAMGAHVRVTSGGSLGLLLGAPVQSATGTDLRQLRSAWPCSRSARGRSRPPGLGLKGHLSPARCW
jgi:MFS family permease